MCSYLIGQPASCSVNEQTSRSILQVNFLGILLQDNTILLKLSSVIELYDNFYNRIAQRFQNVVICYVYNIITIFKT
jgi:hypothetical protein